MINFDKDELYPLLFEPLYKEVMWGGTQLASKLNRPIPEDGPAIGEAWEICDREGFSSLVANGRSPERPCMSWSPVMGKNLSGTDSTEGFSPCS